MLEQNVLGLAYGFQFLFQVLIVEQLVYLETDFCIFILVEWSDTGFGGTKGFSAQTLFLILIEQDVVRHYHLCTVGNFDLRCRHSLRNDLI